MPIINVCMEPLVADHFIQLIQSNDIIPFKTFLQKFPSYLNLLFPSQYLHLKKHSLFYCTVYYNKYEMVDFLLTTYPHSYKMSEFPDYIRQCCNHHQKYDLFMLLLMKCNISLDCIINALSDPLQTPFLHPPFLMMLMQFYGNELFTDTITTNSYYMHHIMSAAIDRQLITVIQDILEYGFDLNILYHNVTPLHLTVYLSTICSRPNDFKIVTMLLNHGAFINIENSFGYRPIEYSYSNSNKNELMYLFLLQHGSVPSISNPHMYARL